jgi:hypothetical protein
MKAKKNSLEKKMTLEEPTSTPSRCKSDNNMKKTLESFFRKKIKFSSAFDQKGSKQFLHSKKEALQQIIIDDDDDGFFNSSNNNDNDDIEIKSVNIKHQKNIPYRHPKTFINNRGKIEHPNSTNNLFKYSNTNINKAKGRKEKNKLNKEKEKDKDKEKKSNHNSVKRIYSSQELKMFEDKEIRKIKPIKKVSNFLINKNIIKNSKRKSIPLGESFKSIDSSLFNIVAQIK